MNVRLASQLITAIYVTISNLTGSVQQLQPQQQQQQQQPTLSAKQSQQWTPHMVNKSSLAC
jgi:hypothetical protein